MSQPLMIQNNVNIYTAFNVDRLIQSLATLLGTIRMFIPGII